jgi:ABC-type lipoprotein release transport system permease subunit
MLALIVILTLTSTLFSVTAYSFLGFYNGFANYVGEEKGIVAIYSRIGSTPFSGVVPIDLSSKIEAIDGVVAVSPEAIAPCTINDHSVFVRGVISQELTKLTPLVIIDGQNLNITDTNSAIIGQSLADRFRIKTGDKILAYGILSKQYVELQVKGIFQSNSALNDEALVPLYVGQWLRGLSYNDATLLRTKINLNQTNPDQIYTKIINQTSPSTITSSPNPKSQTQQELEALLPLAQANLNVGNIGVEESQQFMQSYLGRYGISKDTLIVLSIVVLVFASGTASCAVTLFVKQHSFDIDVMRSIGVSKKKIKIDLILRMVTWALISTVLGTIISALVIIIFQKIGCLQVLSHTITFQLDPLIVVANFLLLSVLISINMVRMELKQ